MITTGNQENLKIYEESLSLFDGNRENTAQKGEDKNFSPDLEKKLSQPINQYARKHRVRSEIWDNSDVRKIFHLYNQYGSQWKLISEEFDSKQKFPQQKELKLNQESFLYHHSDSLKKFVSLARNLPDKLPQEISSKLILKFYQGLGEFSRFKGFGKKVMKKINYNPESHLLPEIVQNYKEQILNIYETIYLQGRRSKSQKGYKKEKCPSAQSGNGKKIDSSRQIPAYEVRKEEQDSILIDFNRQEEGQQKTVSQLPLFGCGPQVVQGFYIPNNGMFYYPYNFSYCQFQ